MKRRYWLSWIVVLYAFALFMPAIRSADGGLGRGTPGYFCLLFVPVVCFFPAWWANPALFAGCVYLAAGNDRRARTLGVIASVLAFSFFPMVEVDGLGTGAIVWAACPVILSFAAHRLAVAKTYKPKAPEDWGLE